MSNVEDCSIKLGKLLYDVMKCMTPYVSNGQLFRACVEFLARAFCKDPQHCSNPLKSSGCCVAQPWNTLRISVLLVFFAFIRLYI